MPGVKLLMEKHGVDRVEKISLAGAFGTFIDPKYALVMGLVPDCEIAGVKAVGNAAGTGARMALLNRDHRREIEDTVKNIEKIETALEPKFQEHFVNAMAFPNKVERFPRLEAEVTLPVRNQAAASGSGEGSAPPSPGWPPPRLMAQAFRRGRRYQATSITRPANTANGTRNTPWR